MLVKDIMTRKVITVEFDDRLERVKEIFDNLLIHHLLVVEDGELFGVLSDRDLLKALSPNLGTSFETQRDQDIQRAHHFLHSHCQRRLSAPTVSTSALSAGATSCELSLRSAHRWPKCCAQPPKTDRYRYAWVTLAKRALDQMAISSGGIGLAIR
jgi:hypothetical protein